MQYFPNRNYEEILQESDDKWGTPEHKKDVELENTIKKQFSLRKNNREETNSNDTEDANYTRVKSAESTKVKVTGLSITVSIIYIWQVFVVLSFKNNYIFSCLFSGSG